MRPTALQAAIGNSIDASRGTVTKHNNSIAARLYRFWARNTDAAPAEPTRCDYYKGALRAPKLWLSMRLRPVVQAVEHTVLTLIMVGLVYHILTHTTFGGFISLLGKLALALLAIVALGMLLSLGYVAQQSLLGRRFRFPQKRPLLQAYAELKALMSLPRLLLKRATARHCPTVKLTD